jgi:hypothetical protein
MPPLPLPTDFQEQLNTTGANTSAAESGGAVITMMGSNRRDRADVYVGMVFDGDRKYDNFTSSLPGLQFQFFLPPTIDQPGDVLIYDPHRQGVVEIRVSILVAKIVTYVFLTHRLSHMCSGHIYFSQLVTYEC